MSGPDHPLAVRFGCQNMNDAMLSYSHTQDAIESALLFLPHAPSASLKMKRDTRQSHSVGRTRPKQPRQESADGRILHRNDFTVPTLDFEGCLGGF